MAKPQPIIHCGGAEGGREEATLAKTTSDIVKPPRKHTNDKPPRKQTW